MVLSVATSDKPRETLKGMQWKAVAENEVMYVRSAFAQVNLTVGTFQKVMTDVLIRRMFTDPEVISIGFIGPVTCLQVVPAQLNFAIDALFGK